MNYSAESHSISPGGGHVRNTDATVSLRNLLAPFQQIFAWID